MPFIIPFSSFFNATATTEIYTLSLHDALPILHEKELPAGTKIEIIRRDDTGPNPEVARRLAQELITRDRVNFLGGVDRKSTRLNSSHMSISYAVFCLKKKKKLGYTVWTLIECI